MDIDQRRIMRLVFAFQLAIVGGRAQKIAISFDYSNADATLQAFAAPLDTTLEDLAVLPATDSLVQKVRGRYRDVTKETLTTTLAEARKGTELKSDPFQWASCLRKQAEIRTLAAGIREQQNEIARRLVGALGRHLTASANLKVNVHFVIGGMSAGWSTGTDDFYVGLQFYRGDVEGVVMTMQHELFHSAQFDGYRGRDADLAKLGPADREVYQLVDQLYREGTATYVEDLMSFSPDHPYIQEMRQPALNNQARMKDNFILLETLIYRLSQDSSVRFDDVYPLGFDWAWQNPLYFADEYISHVLAKDKGSLSSYLTRNPIKFLSDYHAVCGTAVSEKCRYPLTPGIASIIEKIDKRLATTP
ncbi:MAG: hypothetical protein K2X03_17905 [Bryobacteraceae bacterium]|nr:hypothetical protein [Bryobacteraceae bacterium]